MQIIENFLSNIEFLEIRNTILGKEFPWVFNEQKVTKLDSDDNLSNLYNFQNTHLFYGNGRPLSLYFDKLNNLILKLQPAALIKVKANLTTRTERVIKSSFHTDNNFENSFTSIFYLNTNNGVTYFEDGLEIQSIANRLVTFPSSKVHAGSTSSDTNFRVVLNLNYFKN